MAAGSHTGDEQMIKADGYSTDEGRHINRVTQRSPEEDKRVQRLGGLITVAVLLAVAAIIVNLCWGG